MELLAEASVVVIGCCFLFPERHSLNTRQRNAQNKKKRKKQSLRPKTALSPQRWYAIVYLTTLSHHPQYILLYIFYIHFVHSFANRIIFFSSLVSCVSRCCFRALIRARALNIGPLFICSPHSEWAVEKCFSCKRQIMDYCTNLSIAVMDMGYSMGPVFFFFLAHRSAGHHRRRVFFFFWHPQSTTVGTAQWSFRLSLSWTRNCL